MKSLVIASALVLFAAHAVAAEGPVSAATLAGMGLENMQQLSDRDGQAVRGKGPFDAAFFWNRNNFGSSTGPAAPGFQGPTMSNRFADRFGFPGFGDSIPGGGTPGGGTPGGNTPGGIPSGPGTPPGPGNFPFGPFTF
jgi:hypothetical protein